METEAIRLGYTFGRNTVYRLLKSNGPHCYDRDTLTALVASIRSLTNEKIEVGDLIKFEE